MNQKVKNIIHGWLVLDKPTGMTSTQAVGKIKRLLQPKKVGHAGTLDPLASGLLPLAFGEATKTVSFIMDSRKIYRFTVQWGTQTDTDDSEGTAINQSDIRPSSENILAKLPQFIGTISQVPPQFSAIKIDGERAYNIARAGKTVELTERSIKVHRLELIEEIDKNNSVFELECGKGTYVRSIARDLAQSLNTFGHVVALRRLRVGPFLEEHLISFDTIEKSVYKDNKEKSTKLTNLFRPIETMLDDIPALAVDRNDVARLRNGQAILMRGRDAIKPSGLVSVISAGTIVALAEYKDGFLHPKRVFNFNSE